MYGIPHGWGANVLMWNPKIVTTAPTSWGAVFDANSPYKGEDHRVRLPDLHRRRRALPHAHQPDLKITNPYELDQTQFDAAVALLKAQHSTIGTYWGAAADEISSFESGATAIGTAWQYQANTINADKKVTVDTVVPTEGATGWSDTWMVASKAKHPNCMYQWMNWIVSPKVNAEVAQWFGEAPAQTMSCVLADKGFCDDLPRPGRGLREQDLLLDDADQELLETRVVRRASPTRIGPLPGRRSRASVQNSLKGKA